MVQQVYNFLSARKGATAIGVALTLLLCLTQFISSNIRADIHAMLPEGNNGILTRDFELLAQSNLAANIFITIQRSKTTSREDLIHAAKSLSTQLRSSSFDFVDPTSVNPVKALNFLLNNAPNLIHKEDLKAIENQTKSGTIKETIQTAFRQLSSPQGLVTKQFIRLDPLTFRSFLAPRLSQLNSFSDATITDNHLFSRDDTAILLTAHTDIPMTDADGAAELLKQFEEARQKLPNGIKAEIISGHVHTALNASTIKRDLLFISAIAAIALTLLFILFFRTKQALGVFIVPAAAMCCALGGLALFHETVSAIVIGFGAVLIGISIDFAMHVYFAIARHQGDPGTATQALTKPILFCVLTSCAAFGALFLSGIPGIRQLALFSICGLIASSILSLFILPLMSNKATVRPMPSGLSIGTSPYPKLALTLWAIIMGICIWFGSSTSIDPDLRNIGYRPTSLQETEKRFSSIWGDIRSRGVVFAQANTLQEALLKNDNVYADLKSAYPTLKATSISPLLPSDKSQRNSQELWDKFWTNERIHQVETDIRKAGTSLGFSKKAFHPFEILLQTRPVNINADSLEIASMGLIKNMFLLKSSSGKTVVTYVPDTKEVRSFFSPKKEQALGVHMVSNARFKSLLESTMKSDIKYFITASGSAVFVLAFLLFRDFRRSSLALLPAITGITAVFGVLGMTNTDLNLFHITALPLIIGLGADYGIFIVTEESQALELSTVPAVTVSGLTTLAGFGVLSLARHPSLHSMGVTVLIGITAALICALFIIPHFLRKLS